MPNLILHNPVLGRTILIIKFVGEEKYAIMESVEDLKAVPLIISGNMALDNFITSALGKGFRLFLGPDSKGGISP